MVDRNRATMAVLMVLIVMVALSLVAGPSQGQERRGLDVQLAEILERLDDMSVRIERLEYVAGSYIDELEAQAEGGDDELGMDFERPASLSNAISGRYMIVDGLTTEANTDDHSEEIARLRSDIRSLEQTVMSEEGTLASIQGSGTSGRGGSQADERRRRYSAQQRVVSNYKRALSKRRAELTRYENARAAQKQIIQGNREGRVITLHTEYDLSSDMTEIGIDDFVTWSGRRVEMDGESEVWIVRSVRKIEDAKNRE